MDKWHCIPCDYVYDPAEGDEEGGIQPGGASEDLPEDWVCPICGVGKDEFEKVALIKRSVSEKPDDNHAAGVSDSLARDAV